MASALTTSMYCFVALQHATTRRLQPAARPVAGAGAVPGNGAAAAPTPAAAADRRFADSGDPFSGAAAVPGGGSGGRAAAAAAASAQQQHQQRLQQLQQQRAEQLEIRRLQQQNMMLEQQLQAQRQTPVQQHALDPNRQSTGMVGRYGLLPTDDDDFDLLPAVGARGAAGTIGQQAMPSGVGSAGGNGSTAAARHGSMQPPAAAPVLSPVSALMATAGAVTDPLLGSFTPGVQHEVNIQRVGNAAQPGMVGVPTPGSYVAASPEDDFENTQNGQPQLGQHNAYGPGPTLAGGVTQTGNAAAAAGLSTLGGTQQADGLAVLSRAAASIQTGGQANQGVCPVQQAAQQITAKMRVRRQQQQQQQQRPANSNARGSSGGGVSADVLRAVHRSKQVG